MTSIADQIREAAVNVTARQRAALARWMSIHLCLGRALECVERGDNETARRWLTEARDVEYEQHGDCDVTAKVDLPDVGEEP